MKNLVNLFLICIPIASIQLLNASEPDTPITYTSKDSNEILVLGKNIHAVEIEKTLYSGVSGQVSKSLHTQKLNLTESDLTNYQYKMPLQQLLTSNNKTFLQSDGFYSEKVLITAKQRDSKATIEELNWNYFKVEAGLVTPISSTEYSKAMEKSFTVVINGKAETNNAGFGIVERRTRKSLLHESDAIRVDKPLLNKSFDTSEIDEQ